MAAGDIELCNAALALLGEAPINSFEDSSANGPAGLCNTLWRDCCANLLAQYHGASTAARSSWPS